MATSWPPPIDIVHREGLPWTLAPIPRPWHRCRPWTTASYELIRVVERCACGATRFDRGRWFGRNTRRRP